MFLPCQYLIFVMHWCNLQGYHITIPCLIFFFFNFEMSISTIKAAHLSFIYAVKTSFKTN